MLPTSHVPGAVGLDSPNQAQGLSDHAQKLMAREMAYNNLLTVNSYAQNNEISRRMTLKNIEHLGYVYETTIANQAAKRTLSSLASKFSLIQKIQQNMG